MSRSISRRLFTTAMLAGMAAPGIVRADEAWPAKTIRMVVPWPPGGPVDKYCRALADALAEPLGRAVIVENRAGAGGILGTEYASRAKPDGYTLLGTNSTAFVGNVVATPEIVRYDPIPDFEPIALFQEGASVIFAHASLGAKNLDDFIRIARASDKPVPYATSGPGAGATLAGNMLAKKYGINLLPVVYRGGGPRLTALVAGEVKFALFDIGLVRDHVAAGTLTPIVSSGSAAPADWPGLPNFVDLGLTTPDLTAWHAVFAPTGVPRPVAEKLRAAIDRVVRGDAFRQVAADGGGRAIFVTGDAARERIARHFAERRAIPADNG